LIAQVLANLTYNAVKHTVARHRPLSAVVSIAPFEDLKIDDTWLGWQPGNTVRATQSFPSGHTAAALALTGVLAFYYSRIAWMFWILALGCGVSRVLDLQHWLTDCVAGALIGYLAAIAALALTQQLFSGPRQAIGPSRIPSRG
jgi:membrane-associated phospholipid phosphatase